MKQIKLLILVLTMVGFYPMQAQNSYQAIDQHENYDKSVSYTSGVNGSTTVFGNTLSGDVLRGSSPYFYEDFSSVPSFEIPEGWSSFVTSPDNVYCNGGEAILMRQNSVLNPVVLISPLINLELAEVFSFSHGAAESAGTEGEVGYMTDVNNLESFVSIQEFEASPGWATESINVSDINGGIGEVYLAWKLNTVGSMSYFSIDNVTLTHEGSSESYSVTFDVKDDDGYPIVWADVTLEGMGNQTTNPIGLAVFENVELGTYSYSVQADGYTSYTGEVEVTNADIVENVTMQPMGSESYSVTFDVKDDDGYPIAWADVTLEGMGNQTTNPIGLAVFENVEPGTYSYSVQADGYTSYTGEVEVVDADVVENVTMQPMGSESYSVTFDVKDADGYPIAWADISLEGMGNQITNPIGMAVFDNVEPGTYNYSVQADGYTSYTGEVEVTNADIVENVTLQPMGSESYSVTFDVKDDDGYPMGWVDITLEGVGSETTNPIGLAVFDNVEPGTYSYSVQADGYTSYTGEVEVTNADIVENVTMQPMGSESYTVTFDVKDADGYPIAWATVAIEGMGNQITNPIGLAVFENVEPGTYSYSVQANNFAYYTSDVEVVDVDVVENVILQPMDSEHYFHEDFSSVPSFEIPEGWSKLVTSPDDVYCYGGEAILFRQNPVLNPVMIISPLINLELAGELYFSHGAAEFAGTEGEVGYMTDVNDPDSFVSILGFEASPGWGTEIISVSNINNGSGEVYLAWRLNTVSDMAYYSIDNVILTHKGSSEFYSITFNVKDDSGNSVTGAAVILEGVGIKPTDENGETSFDVQSGSYNYTVSAAGFTIYSGEIEVTDEDVVVDVILQSSDSEFYYYEDFSEHPDFDVPVDWTKIVTPNDMIYCTNEEAILFRQSAVLNPIIIASPLIDLDPAGELIFDYGQGSTALAEFGYMTDLSDVNSFVSVLEFEPEIFWKSETINVYNINGGTGAVYLAWKLTSESFSYFSLDNVRLTYGDDPILLPPTNLAAEVIDDVNVKLTWDAPAKALKGYNVYRNDDLIAENISTTTYLDVNLPPSTYTYYVRALYDEGLSAPTETVTISITTGVDENHMGSISIYPNPASGFVNVVTSAQNAVLRVMDIQGRILLTKQLNKDCQQIDISQLNSGLYLFVVTTEHNTHTQRVIVK